MKYALAVAALCALLAGSALSGCSGKSDSDVTTVEQAREEAAKTITPANADAELQKITKEIDADKE